MAWLRVVLLLLASGFVHTNPIRHLSGRPLLDNNADVTKIPSADQAGATGPGNGANAADISRALANNSSSSIPSIPQSSPPWELELAPYLSDMYPPRDPNATQLRGPPRLEGVFKGNWLRAVYGGSLRPRDVLTSERGLIELRLTEDDSPAPGLGGVAGAKPTGAGALGDLPGGLHELKGGLLIRDGGGLAEHSLLFKLKGTYVPAAGTLHAVLELQFPHMLHAELPSRDGSHDSRPASEQSAYHVAGGAAADAAAGGSSRPAAGGAESSGYREALRTAARNMLVLGPSWHRMLLRPPPPAPPRPPRSRAGAAGSRRRVAAGGELAPPAPPPGPPRPPLELALMQRCEIRADFRVYYKGDPDAKSHVEFLGLDKPAAAPSPPSPPPRVASSPTPRSSGGGESAGASPGTGAGAASASAATATGRAVRHVRHDQDHLQHPDRRDGQGQQQRRRRRRRLAADTEIYHSTQMQLRAAAAEADAVAAGVTTATAAAPDAVYGIPPGMDPLDPDLELVGSIFSPNCDFELHVNATSVHPERFYRQAIRYSVLVSVVTIAQIVLSVSQAEASSSPSAAARMSLYSTTLQACLDAYQCVLHLTAALVEDGLFAAFTSLALLQLLLFAVFEMRTTLLVWRAQRTNGTGGGDFWTVRRDISAVYFRFYALMLAGLLLMFHCRSYVALLALALHSWWLPQVVHSAQTDTKPPLRASYVWGMSALRLVAPLYFLGCPSNLLRVEQHPWVCVALLVWVGLQAAVLTAQMRMGPRVFIPRAFLPRRYDYHRAATRREMGIEEAHSAGLRAQAAAAATTTSPGGASAAAGRAVPLLRRLVAWLPSAASWLRRGGAGSGTGGSRAAASSSAPSSSLLHRGSGGGGADGDVETGHGSKECVICMNPVPLLPPSARMLTPCGHFFHGPCLTRWMEVKMDCPTCRHPLPPV